MTRSHTHESRAVRVGRCIAIPFRIEAAFWRLFVREGTPGILGQAIKWSVRVVAVAAFAYYLLPLFLLAVVFVAAVYMMGGIHGSASESFASRDEHRFFEEEGLRDGLFGHGHYDKDGNRW